MNQCNNNEHVQCDSHSNRLAGVLKYDLEGNISFQCIKCSDKDKTKRSLIYLDEIFESDNNMISENWPPLSSENLYNELQEIMSKCLQKSELQKKILELEDIQRTINQKINEFKKDFISKYECLNGDLVISKWSEISETDKLKQFILEYKTNKDGLIQFLKQKLIQKQNYSKQIQQEISNYQNQIPLNMDNLNQFKENINIQLDELVQNRSILDISYLQKQNSILLDEMNLQNQINEIELENKNQLKKYNLAEYQQALNQANQLLKQLKTNLKFENIQELFQSNKIFKFKHSFMFSKLSEVILISSGINIDKFQFKKWEELYSYVTSIGQKNGWWILIKNNSIRFDVQLSTFGQKVNQLKTPPNKTEQTQQYKTNREQILNDLQQRYQVAEQLLLSDNRIRQDFAIKYLNQLLI